MHVIIIGGYGTFGLGIAKLLSNETGLTITLAGRNRAKAERAAAHINGAAKVLALKLDRNGDLAQQIAKPPDVIIDASGPFQNYGDDRQDNVIQYALSQGCHYLDLADDLEFVEHIGEYDSAAKDKGVTLLSGLSTYPVLTSAAAKELSRNMEGTTSIMAGIAPSPKAVMGRNVIEAIASYAGKKQVGVLEDGKFQLTYGLTKTKRETICVPGYDPLSNILFSLVEGPDPKILQDQFEGLQDVQLYAGPRPEFLHRLMIGLSWLVRVKLLPGLSGLAGLFHAVQSRIGWGEHRGGMIVRVQNETQSRSWHMIAEGDHGPLIPAIPCTIMIRKWLRGDMITPGARAGLSDISLADYDEIFQQLNIRHGMRQDNVKAANLYEEILGEAYQEQAQPIQDLHRIGQGKIFEGRAKITRGKNPVAGLAADIFRFPKAGSDIPVRVSLTRDGDKEIWLRDFGGRKMRSTQEAGKGKRAHLVIERFGPVAVYLAVIIKEGRLRLQTKGWSVFGIPLPRFLAPGGDVYEHDANGRFNFYVDICAPVLGRLVKYEGWLEPLNPD